MVGSSSRGGGGGEERRGGRGGEKRGIRRERGGGGSRGRRDKEGGERGEVRGRGGEREGNGRGRGSPVRDCYYNVAIILSQRTLKRSTLSPKLPKTHPRTNLRRLTPLVKGTNECLGLPYRA